MNKEDIGVILSRMEDEGPTVVFNASNLEEPTPMMLAVQMFTAISLGTGAPEGLYGPIPVPEREDLQVLVYPFLSSGADSTDSRIQMHGRQNMLMMIFPKGYIHYGPQIQELFEPYLKSFLAMGELTKKRVYILREQIVASAIFKLDITQSYLTEIEQLREENAKLKAIIKELKEDKIT
ncbi:MAG: hypothetical protein ACFFBD_25965 [Candidatus Hodarchaeota archaeon]